MPFDLERVGGIEKERRRRPRHSVLPPRDSRVQTMDVRPISLSIAALIGVSGTLAILGIIPTMRGEEKREPDERVYTIGRHSFQRQSFREASI